MMCHHDISPAPPWQPLWQSEIAPTTATDGGNVLALVLSLCTPSQGTPSQGTPQALLVLSLSLALPLVRPLVLLTLVRPLVLLALVRPLVLSGYCVLKRWARGTQSQTQPQPERAHEPERYLPRWALLPGVIAQPE